MKKKKVLLPTCGDKCSPKHKVIYTEVCSECEGKGFILPNGGPDWKEVYDCSKCKGTGKA